VKVELAKGELLLIDHCIKRALPMLVYEHTADGAWCYCPHCHAVIDHEYADCCECCGQRLSWYGTTKHAVYAPPVAKEIDE